MFDPLLYALRAQGVRVGSGEWLAFLDALERGLAVRPLELYHLGRALLCHSETQFDAYDLAFAAAFAGAELPQELRDALAEWLRDARERPDGPPPPSPYESIEDLLRAFEERLREQKERHDGGNRWVGTGGTSPFGRRGNNRRGVSVGPAGGDPSGGGGGRTAVALAEGRQWANYRTDQVLGVRDFEVALKALRHMAREGRWELDIDATIDGTARNGGEIDLVERRERANRVHLVLLMDSGGSMAPHAQRVETLFTAADRLSIFKSFTHYYFHNCVYNWLYTNYETNERRPTAEVLSDLGPQHRLIFVGDASMAPYELFSSYGGYGDHSPSGLDWLRRFRERCPASVWLNPEPTRFWAHPTVSAIGKLFPMEELTVDGIRAAVKRLRAPV